MTALATRLTRTRRPRRGGGFTLIELVAVMVVLAVLAATAGPALSSIDGTRSAMAGKQLLRDLTFARQRAVATGTRTWVVFDTAAETWTILGEDPLSPGRGSATVLGDTATGGTFVQALGTGAFKNVGITSAAFDGDVEVGFDWFGRPYNAAETALAADGSVTLTGGHVVTVIAGTGLATFAAP